MTLVRTALMLGLSVALMGRTASHKSESPLSAQSKTGTICVLPNSSEPPTRISPGGAYNPATLTVSVDNQEPILWPHKEPLRIEHLNLAERHLVILTSDGKRIQSFWFRFSDFKDVELCLYFDGYQGVQLGDKRDALWCRCKSRVFAQEHDTKPDKASQTPPVAQAQQQPRIRVKEDVQKAKLVHMVYPMYPRASAKRMDGTVVLHVLIGKDGAVRSAKYVSGPENLANSAINAVVQWRYKPTSRDGAPVEVDTTVSVVFPSLAEPIGR